MVEFEWTVSLGIYWIQCRNVAVELILTYNEVKHTHTYTYTYIYIYLNIKNHSENEQYEWKH